MTSLATRNGLVVITGLTLLAALGVAVHGRQEPPEGSSKGRPATETSPRAGASEVDLARQQLVLIDQALAVLHQMAVNGRISFADASFSVWDRRKLEAVRKSGADRAEMVAVLEAHLKRLGDELGLAEERKNQARGTVVDVLDVRYRISEAEAVLNEVRGR